MRTRYEVVGWGVGELWMRGEVLLAHDFDFEPQAVVSGWEPVEHDLVERFTAFLGGQEVVFDDVQLDLRSTTPFQRDVTAALRAIPRGEVVSYGELAALAGYPGAARAVGTFCSNNRFAFVVPCHRVVAADGIGSYGSAGVTTKRRLLALEGVLL